MSEIALKPTTLAATLKALIPQRTLCINVTGQPGIGKSAIVKQVAAELGMNFIDIRAVLLDPVDFRGVPSVEGGRTKFNPPDFLPKPGCGKTVLFFDEVDKAPSLTQCGLLQITLDRRLGEYKLPDEVTIVSAMNRQGDRAGSQKLNTALANRFVHLNLMADNQGLTHITSAVLKGLEPILRDVKPDRVLVHGDTTTTLAASMAAFYAHVPVGHVEAGLRTGDMQAPWPEEMNRRVADTSPQLRGEIVLPAAGRVGDATLEVVGVE